MTTRLTLQTAIRVELQEPTEGFWLNSELQTWMNESNSEITKATRQIAQASFTATASVETVSLPADFFLARRVEIQTLSGSPTNWRELQPLSLDYRRPSDPTNPFTVTGVPFGYYISGGLLHLIPQPDQAYTGTLYYYKNAIPMAADGDSPSYPEGIDTTSVDRAIKMYVYSQALRKRQDGAYVTYAGDYNELLKGIVKDATRRGTGAPLMVHDDWAGTV